MSTQTLESRIAALENSLARVNEPVAKTLNGQGQEGRRVDEVVNEDKTCKDVMSRIDAIVAEFDVVQSSVAKILKFMTEDEWIQKSTEMDDKTLRKELAKADHLWQVILGLLKQKSNTKSPSVGSSEPSEEEPKEGSKEEHDGESDDESEKDDEDEDEPDEGGFNEMMDSLYQILGAHAAQSSASNKTRVAVEAAYYKLRGIDILLHQQKRTQSRIASHTEKVSQDLTYIIDIVKNLQTAVSEQGHCIDLMLRRQMAGRKRSVFGSEVDSS